MANRTVPIVSTIAVALAVLAMVALGVWQLERRHEKEAQLAQLSANLVKPAITFPAMGPVDKAIAFRRSSATCLSVEGWHIDAGEANDGSSGFRYTAHCATGIEGPGVSIALGIGNRPDLKPDWDGGVVKGWIVLKGNDSSLLDKFLAHDRPTTAILIADEGVAGLKTLAVPSVDSVPNNHLAYAVQWFLFAFIALVIYILMLRRRAIEAKRP